MGIRTEHIKGLLEGISEEDALELVPDLAVRFGWIQTTFNRDNVVVRDTDGNIVNDWDSQSAGVTDDEFAAVTATYEWRDGIPSGMSERGYYSLPSVVRNADGTFEVEQA